MATLLKIFIVMLSFSSAALAADEAPTGTAALVNGAVITSAHYRGELARILRLRKKSEQDLDPVVLAQTKKEALDTLIGRELLYQESLREGVKIRDAEVDTEIEKLRRQFPTEEDFNASLKKIDLSMEAVQSQIKRGMAIQALINTKFSSKSKLQRERMLSDVTLYQKRLRKAARVEIHLAGDN